MYLRFHHLEQLATLYKNYKVWQSGESGIFRQQYKLPFEQLYSNKQALNEFLVFEKSVQRDYYYGKINRNQLKPNIRDYVGTQGEFLDSYINARTNIAKNMLLQIPARPVSIGYYPDDICESCQLKPDQTLYGQHCTESLGNKTDFYYEEGLNRISDPSNMIRIEGPTTEIKTTIGFLRNITASKLLQTKVNEVTAEFELVEKDLGQQNFLSMQGEYIRVPSSYIGKEGY